MFGCVFVRVLLINFLNHILLRFHFLMGFFYASSCREAVLVRSLRRLREQIVRANLLVQEACFISEELERHTEYRVTLQIPSDNLNANRKVSHTNIMNTLCMSVLPSVSQLMT